MSEVEAELLEGPRSPCAGCHYPFEAAVDICVVVFALEGEPRPLPHGIYHVPCYERADGLEKHRTVIGLTYADENNPPPEDVNAQAEQFAVYVQRRAAGVEEELEDEELEARWPIVMELMAAQRARVYGGAN